ncbi:MAG: hypothetical protein M3R70_13820 [Actinomycetota bacterium]|nr:hypothetical protein [Actinomycetota bacterium]
MSATTARPAVVLGLERTGLAVARALGRAGLPVAGIGWRDYDFGLRSRYLSRRYRSSDGDETALAALRAEAGYGRPVVFPTEDESIEFLLRHWDEVRELADLPLPDDAEVMTGLRRKEQLPAQAEKAGVHAPRTIYAESEEAIRAMDLQPPFLVKPVEGKKFEAAFSRKAFVADGLDDAVGAWRIARERGFETIVQELVPDAEERIFSLFTYIGRDGEPLVSVTGRKVRQLPVHFGSSTVFSTSWQPRAFELGQRLLRSAGYRGFAHVEFAHDRRDDSYKVIEVNTRPPLWMAVATGGADDIIRTAYDDLSGAPARAGRIIKDEVAWVDLSRDLRQAVRRRDFRPGAFVAPYLTRRKERVFLATDDPVPAVYLGKRIVTRLLEKRG